jgi:hypothetical protein
MRSSLVTLALSMCALLSACEKDKPSTPTAAVSTTAVTPPPAAPTTSPAPTAAPTGLGAAAAPENIPVAADFEDEAEKSITKANYRAELDSLEAEIK